RRRLPNDSRPKEEATMNDTDKPALPPAAPDGEAPAQRPEPKLGAPPNLSPEEVYGSGLRLRDLDAQIEQELQEAMSGLSDKELYGEPEQVNRKAPPSPDQGRKKARVMAVHGPDVFLDVPGGRSQGVLPLLQFPEGTPAIGTEVDVGIEGYDQANGLLLL